MPLQNGGAFAGYTVSESLGADPTSELYLAQASGTDLLVVLRIVGARLSADPSYREAFVARLDSVADLTHPHLPRVHGYGEHDGRLWSAMETVDGPTCGRLLAGRYRDGMPPKATAMIVAAVADALDYLHDRGVAHGAVRPDVIQLTRSDTGPDSRRILLNGLDVVSAPAAPDGDAADRAALAMTELHLRTGRVPAPAAAPVTSPPRARRPLPRVLTAVGAVIAVAVLVAVAAFFVRDRYYQSHAAPPPEEPATGEASPTALPPPGPPACGEGDALLAQMSQRQKLAQLLMVGVNDLADAQQVVAREQVGGIMIGSWTDLSMLGDPLNQLSASASPLPLAVSTDEEGGRVSRLSSLIGVQPSARAMVDEGWTVDQVYAEALRRGQAMRGLGVTVDFAPVVDVSDQPDDTVIGDRSFSDDPAVVTEYAGEYARGLHDGGVMPVLKHFPGHGQASGDSHEGGVTTPPLDALKARDLIPYQTLVNQNGAAVMVGHMNVPGLTNGEQASLSPAAYQLLRGGAGYGGPPFNGLIFTDDLSSMGAINQSYTVPEAVLKSLQAGADIALWITTDAVTSVLDRLEAAVASGELNPALVDQSVLRIASAKGKKPDCGG